MGLLTVPLVLALVFGASPGTDASDPPSGAIGPPPASSSVTWEGPVVQTAVTPGPDNCADPGAFCDDFSLTVTADLSYWDTHSGGATVTISWGLPDDDFDLYIYRGEEIVAQSGGTATTSETVFLPQASGTYLVRTVYFAVTASGYTGTATFESELGLGGAFFDATEVGFAPASIVSAHFLGSEPMTAMERVIPGSEPGATSNQRFFVDWPLSSRSNIGQISRSLDGGNSFRLLLDLTCAPRSRPNCATGGGGDTDTEVNLQKGTLFFSDQEVVAAESLSSSIDHGDSFPPSRQFAITNQTTVVDRQWLAWSDPSVIAIGAQGIEGFLAYHLPGVGQYIQGILGATGAPVPQPVPQIAFVAQSGPLRVDNTNGPGRGWIYQSYRSFLGHPQGALHYFVATAYGPDGDDIDVTPDYQVPANWQDNKVTDDNPAIFPWLNLDGHGNAYAVWVTGGVMYYSASPIDDRANNPDLGGRPGTYWTPQVRVSLPEVGSAVFPEVTAGDAGLIGITYDGTTEFTGVSDDAPPGTDWNTYGAVIRNALQTDGPAVVSTGLVSHRVIHTGSICTSGTTCTGDRSLLDMTDLGFDNAGRLGVVFTDNNSTFASPGGPDATKGSPFVHFAMEVKGPTLESSRPTVDITIPMNVRRDVYRDATWPNTASGANLPSLDLASTSITLQGGSIVARIKLADVTTAGMMRDLAAYNAVPATTPPAERLQYVVRFSSGSEIYHLSMESLADGTRRFFGGLLDANDRLVNVGSTSALGAGYHTDAAIPVTGSVKLKTKAITITAPASAFGLTAGTPLFSVSGFAMAGPSEANETIILNVMRTVDANPPFDAML